jgi:hypothetical protein
MRIHDCTLLSQVSDTQKALREAGEARRLALHAT